MSELKTIPWIDSALNELLAADLRLGHALLLTGAPGLGKSLLAQQFVAAQLCETPLPDHRACGTCLACNWLMQGSHPDFRQLSPIEEGAADKRGKAVKASKEIKVDQVRGLSDFLAVGGHRGGSRMVLIDPADALNVVAANALLKTLEEPQSTVRFVLVSGRPSALPVTIRSRCQTLVVRSPSADQALAWLAAQSGADPAQARLWLAAAGGAPLHALPFARDEFATAYRLVVETLARLPDTPIVNAADSLASLQAGQWLPVLQSWVHDLGRLMVGHQPIRHLPQVARLQELGLRTLLPRLTQLSVWLDQQAQLTDHPMNARLFCESILMRYTGIFGQGAK